MLFIKIYLMVALPVAAAVFMVYVQFRIKKKIDNLKKGANKDRLLKEREDSGGDHSLTKDKGSPRS